MSKEQWGHGFHTGKEKGFKDGTDLGEKVGLSVGGLYAGEYAWHSVCAAIEAIESGNDLRGLMLLRTLRYALANVTGHEVPDLANIAPNPALNSDASQKAAGAGQLNR